MHRLLNISSLLLNIADPCAAIVGLLLHVRLASHNGRRAHLLEPQVLGRLLGRRTHEAALDGLVVDLLYLLCYWNIFNFFLSDVFSGVLWHILYFGLSYIF